MTNHIFVSFTTTSRSDFFVSSFICAEIQSWVEIRDGDRAGKPMALHFFFYFFVRKFNGVLISVDETKSLLRVNYVKLFGFPHNEKSTFLFLSLSGWHGYWLNVHVCSIFSKAPNACSVWIVNVIVIQSIYEDANDWLNGSTSFTYSHSSSPGDIRCIYISVWMSHPWQRFEWVTFTCRCSEVEHSKREIVLLLTNVGYFSDWRRCERKKQFRMYLF